MFRKCIGFLSCFILICHVTFAASLPDISADGAILIETHTNTIVYAKNSNLAFYPASTTKILTSLAIAKDLPMDQIVTKSQSSIDNVPSDSSQIGLPVGSQYSVYDGLHAVLMASDNFVCYDLAVTDAGSINKFADRMNRLANECGARNYHFVNPHGYHDENHYVSPYSLAKIAEQAFSNPIVLDIAGTLNYNFHVQNTGAIIPLKHTALLLDPESAYYNPHVIAAKTGFHTPARRTLVARATYDNLDFVGVVMRTDAPLQFEDMNKLFAYGSENFELQNDADGTPYLENNTYSAWAKPYVEKAKQEGWIPDTVINYTVPVSKREFITLLHNAVSDQETDELTDLIHYNGDSIYTENLSLTREQLAKIIFNYLSQYEMYPISSGTKISDIADLSQSTQDAINFSVDANLISLKENNQFAPDSTISYEEALCITSKIQHIVERYNNFKFNHTL